jgi:heme exporter protein B
VSEVGLGDLVRASWAVFRKDLRVELRTRYALNALLMFVLCTALVASFYLGPQLQRRDDSANATLAVLLWIAILFAALTGLARSFVGEEEAQTTLFLRLHAPTLAVFWGKWLVNVLLLSVLILLTTLFFGILTGLRVANLPVFVLVLGAGGLGLATATTIIAQASARSALFAALAVPVVFPLLILVVRVTDQAITGTTWNVVRPDLVGIVAYVVTLIVATIWLFPFVWEA